MRDHWLLALTLSLLLAASARAHEPGVDGDYDAALTRALAAHVAGNYVQAEQDMKRAHALSPNARTLRGLGVILYAQGRYLESIEPLEQALASSVRPLSPELRQDVEELLDRVWKRVARLLLHVEPGDSHVAIDRAEPLRHGRELVLTPGEHRVEISAPGRLAYALTLQTRPGSRDSLHVVLAPASPAPAKVAEPTAKPQPGPTHRDATNRAPRVRNSLLIGGGALLVAGGASWVTGFVRYQDLLDECQSKDPGGCDQTNAEERYEEKRIGPLTTTGAVLLSVGAAAVLTAGALELWHFRSGKAQASGLHTRLTLRGSGLSFHASF